MAFCTTGLQLISVFTGILSWTCKNIRCVSLHVTLHVFTICVWYLRDGVSIPGSHTCAITLNLLVPYPEVIPGYLQSVPIRLKLVTTICGSTPFAPPNHMCRPTPHGAGELPSSIVNWCWCHLRLRIWKSQSVLLTRLKVVFTLCSTSSCTTFTHVS